MITASSIFFGVIFSIAITSLQQGSFSNMVDNMVKFYSGYIQVQAPDYKDSRSINNTFESTEDLIRTIERVEKVTQHTSRLESFALASSGDVSQGSIIIGIVPEKEQEISGLKKWISQGEYLEKNDRGILMGEVLAENLDLSLNDTVILLGQGYHGVTAAGLFPVKGIVSLPAPDLNRQIIYMDLNKAQEYYSAFNKETSMIVMVKDVMDVEPTLLDIRGSLTGDYKAYSWMDLQPELVQFIDGKQSSGKIIIYILFVIIAFGILGTVIMLMAERKRELGVMISLGMSRIKLIFVMLVETVLIGIIGVLMGMIVSIPIIFYFVKDPIPIGGTMAETFSDMGFEPIVVLSKAAFIFYDPAITVFFITLLIAIHPIINISRMKVVDALRA
jgi:ABC-type lipoprotein release transport system permease subunit